jgi:3-phosphoshikimate 1-carboxyvinyltransferase
LNLNVSPGQALRGEIILPGDKSISHRAALFASLADGESHFENFLVAGVTDAMLGALKTLGFQWELRGTSLSVAGKSMRQTPNEPGFFLP